MQSDAARAEPEHVRRAIRRRATALEREAVDRALARLEAQGELTDSQREAVAALAAGIVDGVLAGPEATLERAAAEDRETLRTAVALFDPGA